MAQRERSAATQGERGGVGAGAPDEAAVPVLELAGDPLEADQRLDAAYAVAGAEGGDERRGHERLDHRGVRRAGFGQDAGVLEGRDPELGQQGGDLVAVEQAMAAGRQRASHADAVGVGVGREDEVGVDLRGELQREGEGAGVLRIRGGDGREAAVMLALLLHQMRIDADATQGGHDHDVARPVHVGEDDLGRVPRDDLRIEHHAGEAGEVGVLGRGRDREHAGEVLLEIRRDVGRPELADFGDDGGVMRRQHLTPVAEAALEAVVVRRIMTGRDDDAGMGAEVPYRETELRGRAGAGEEVGLAAELRPGAGDQLGEMSGEVANVMGDDQAGAGLGGRDVLPEADDGTEDIDVIEAGRADRGAYRQPLGVDLVGGGDPADRPATHPPGAESDPLIETVFEFGPGAAVAEVPEGGHGLGRQRPRAEPIPGVGKAGGGKLALLLGGLEERKDGGGGAHVSPILTRPGAGTSP